MAGGGLTITEKRFVAYANPRRCFSALPGGPDLSKWRIVVDDGISTGACAILGKDLARPGRRLCAWNATETWPEIPA